MKITIIKNHSAYPLGDVEVSNDRANYLIKMGVAVIPVQPVKFDDPVKVKPVKKTKSG